MDDHKDMKRLEFLEIERLGEVDFGELDSVRTLIMEQAAKFGILGIAMHCIVSHDPFITREDEQTTFEFRAVDCANYAIVCYKMPVDDEQFEHLGPHALITWVATSLLDVDTAKTLTSPALIEGRHLRVEVG